MQQNASIVEQANQSYSSLNLGGIFWENEAKLTPFGKPSKEYKSTHFRTSFVLINLTV